MVCARGIHVAVDVDHRELRAAGPDAARRRAWTSAGSRRWRAEGIRGPGRRRRARAWCREGTLRRAESGCRGRGLRRRSVARRTLPAASAGAWASGQGGRKHRRQPTPTQRVACKAPPATTLPQDSGRGKDAKITVHEARARPSAAGRRVGHRRAGSPTSSPARGRCTATRRSSTATTTIRGRCASTTRERDLDKLDIRTPQPKIHTDIPRLRAGRRRRAVLVGLRAGHAAGRQTAVTRHARAGGRRPPHGAEVSRHVRAGDDRGRRRAHLQGRPDRVAHRHGGRPFDRQLAGDAADVSRGWAPAT